MAGIAEMADRVHTNTWDDNLDGHPIPTDI